MAAASHFLGLDMQATGLQLVIIDHQCGVVGSLRRQFNLQDEDNQLHQPQDWWRAARTGIKELLRRCRLSAGDIRGVGVTGLTDGAVMVDLEGQILCPTQLGRSPDSARALDRLLQSTGQRNLINLTGRQPTETALAVKLLQLSEDQPRVRHDLAAILQPAEFLRFRLTGECATDPSTACRSLLFSPRNRSWSRQLLGQIGIDPELLPGVSPGTQLIGRVTETAAKESGLQAGTPVIAGGAPEAATPAAVGACEAGDLLIELGCEGYAYCLSDSLLRDPSGQLDTGCHCCDQLYTLEATGISPTTGIIWLMDTVLPGEVQQAKRHKRRPLDHFAEMAAETQPGADGLLFLGPDEGACSGFVGLRSDHDRGHLVRAVLESGALSARSLVDRLQQLHCPPKRILVSGPGAANPLWCQMLADAADQTVKTFPQESIAASGSAMMAAVATGAFRSLEQARKKGPKPGATYRPRRAAREAYAAWVLAARRSSRPWTTRSSTAQKWHQRIDEPPRRDQWPAPRRQRRPRLLDRGLALHRHDRAPDRDRGRARRRRSRPPGDARPRAPGRDPGSHSRRAARGRSLRDRVDGPRQAGLAGPG
jgi:xylulokinase